MDPPTEIRHRADLRDYLAAERTFLAWIRTGIALMGFGFVVARFGLFLRELRVLGQAAPTSSFDLSLWFGTALIAIGVVVSLLSAWHHARMVRELDKGETPRCSPLAQHVAIALLLAFIGLAMAIYLVSIRSSSSIHSKNSEESYMAPAAS
jgi:putative membrane protein